VLTIDPAQRKAVEAFRRRAGRPGPPLRHRRQPARQAAVAGDADRLADRAVAFSFATGSSSAGSGATWPCPRSRAAGARPDRGRAWHGPPSRGASERRTSRDRRQPRVRALRHGPDGAGVTFSLPHAAGAWLALACSRALGYAHELRLLLLAGIACGGVGIAGLVAERRGVWWARFGDRPETILPVACSARSSRCRAPRQPASFAPIYRLAALAWLAFAILPLASVGGSRPSLGGTVESCIGWRASSCAGGAIWLGMRPPGRDDLRREPALRHPAPRELLRLVVGRASQVRLLPARRGGGDRLPVRAAGARARLRRVGHDPPRARRAIALVLLCNAVALFQVARDRRDPRARTSG